MEVKDRDLQGAGFLGCWVMTATLRNTFIVFDSKLVIITGVKRWEHCALEFKKIPLIKNESSVNRVHLKLSADLLVGKLL